MADTYQSAVGNLAVFSNKTREDYKEWEKRHAEMVKVPPTEGKQYLNHALNLIRLFEGLGELHPIAKAVVVTFKSVVLFEKDRKENNARVQSVLLAQTDMMHVFIELERLNRQRLSDYEEEESDVDTDALADLGRRVERDIKDCGNSFDTYYNERKLVKFFKSEDWKQRMNGYIQTFTEHKMSVQTLLSFETQRGIYDLNQKLKQLLDTLFVPSEDEKPLVSDLRTLGHPRAWLRDDTRIERLLTLTNDTSFNRPTLSATGTVPVEESERKRAIIQEVREELMSSLEDLCLRNLPFFEQKLDFHTEQLKEAISASAQTVIRALQGPYDRLNHEDLRELWKEMNWIFCVDNRQFLFALQEYYLDRYLKYQRNGAGEAAGTDTRDLTSSENHEQNNGQHPNAWTLFYLGQYSDRILNSIDKDNSGFIRISEANDFTAAMPTSWSLPQWCTYHAIGWLYEDRIYQLRIRNLLLKLCETQVNGTPVSSHPLNRKFMIRVTDYLTSSYFLLSARPTGVEQSPPDELVNLVTSKVLEQDERYRKNLGYFKRLGITASSLALVFRDKEVETYILTLITLLLEEYLQIFELCSSEILDGREFCRMLITTDIVMSLVHSRIGSLQVELRKTEDSTFQTSLLGFRGGLFSAYYQNIFIDGGKMSEMRSLLSVTTHLQDESLLDNFPKEALSSQEVANLHYTTWSEHVERSEGSLSIDDQPPTSWDDKDDSYPQLEWVREPLSFPHLGSVNCDDCHRGLMAGMDCFTCIECFDTDFCSPCWHLAESHKEGHANSHSTVRISLMIPFVYRIWVIEFAEFQSSKLISDIVFHSMKDRSLVEAGEDDSYAERYGADASIITHTSLPCKRCNDPLDLKATTYMCIMHDCKDHVLCESCVDLEPVDNSDGHQRWHTLLAMKDLLIVLRPNEEPQQLHTVGQSVPNETESTDTRIQKLEDRVASLEAELRSANNEMKGLMLEMLSKMSSLTTSMTSRQGPPPTIVHATGPPTNNYDPPDILSEGSIGRIVSGVGSALVSPPTPQMPPAHPSTQGHLTLYPGQDPRSMYHPHLHPAGSTSYQDDDDEDYEDDDQREQLKEQYFPYTLQGPPPASGSRYDDY